MAIKENIKIDSIGSMIDMGLFNSKKKITVPMLSPESVAAGFGVSVIQVLSFFELQIGLNSKKLRQLWAPVMAASTRAAGESTEFILGLYMNNLTHPEITDAVEFEISEPNRNFYDPLNKVWSERLLSLRTQVFQQGYESALKQAQQTGEVNKDLQMKILIAVFEEFGNVCNIDINEDDQIFIQILSMAGSQHIDDLWENLPIYGIENSRIYMQIGSVVIATSFILYFLNIELESQ